MDKRTGWASLRCVGGGWDGGWLASGVCGGWARDGLRDIKSMLWKEREIISMLI